jgi:leucine dehydrogenase
MATAIGQRRRVARKDATARTLDSLDQFDHVEYMSQRGHEEAATWIDRETGLRAIIAVHDTTLGPGLGGTRLRRYDSSAEALLDVLRLSEGMTYKAAVAGLPLGGAKAVILADGKEESDRALRAARFRAFGRFVESLGGRYITAEDVGTTPQDMTEIRRETRHVVGIPREAGGSGDPSPSTAYGVVCGMRALVDEGLGRPLLAGVRVAVQGLGHVGMSLAEQLLRDHGATVIAADVRPQIVEEARARFAGEKRFSLVPADEIHMQECDVFSPCAFGAGINPVTIPQLRCHIVAGAANNQLADEDRDAALLHERDILYAVDYVINAGGLIHVMSELEAKGGWSEEDAARVKAQTSTIYDTLKRLQALAREKGISPHAAARRMADERIQAARASGKKPSSARKKASRSGKSAAKQS